MALGNDGRPGKASGAKHTASESDDDDGVALIEDADDGSSLHSTGAVPSAGLEPELSDHLVEPPQDEFTPVGTPASQAASSPRLRPSAAAGAAAAGASSAAAAPSSATTTGTEASGGATRRARGTPSSVTTRDVRLHMRRAALNALLQAGVVDVREEKFWWDKDQAIWNCELPVRYKPAQTRRLVRDLGGDMTPECPPGEHDDFEPAAAAAAATAATPGGQTPAADDPADPLAAAVASAAATASPGGDAEPTRSKVKVSMPTIDLGAAAAAAAVGSPSTARQPDLTSNPASGAESPSALRAATEPWLTRVFTGKGVSKHEAKDEASGYVLRVLAHAGVADPFYRYRTVQPNAHAPAVVYEYAALFPFPEDLHYEFKSFVKVDLKQVQADIVKYVCAFLNSDGGRLYFGVTDDLVVQGIELTKKEQDLVRQYVSIFLRDVHPTVHATMARTFFHQVNHGAKRPGRVRRFHELVVVEIQVAPGVPDEVYITPQGNAWYRRDAVASRMPPQMMKQRLRRPLQRQLDLVKRRLKDQEEHLRMALAAANQILADVATA